MAKTKVFSRKEQESEVDSRRIVLAVLGLVLVALALVLGGAWGGDGRVAAMRAEDDALARAPGLSAVVGGGGDGAEHDGERPLAHFGEKHRENLLWGSYAGGLFFGLRTRAPRGLHVGLMWANDGDDDVRHEANMHERLTKFGWTRHDGRSFGRQNVVLRPAALAMSFVKYDDASAPGGSWTARAKMRMADNVAGAEDVFGSLVLYALIEDGDERSHVEYDAARQMLHGHSPDVGPFAIRLDVDGAVADVHTLGKRLGPGAQTHKLHGIVKSSLRPAADEVVDRKRGIRGGRLVLPDTADARSSFLAVQFRGPLPLAVTAAYEAGTDTADADARDALLARAEARTAAYRDDLQARSAAFDERFDRVFPLTAPGVGDGERTMGMYALSNMLGGMSYFYGAPRIQTGNDTSTLRAGFDAPLFTAIPSRPFFPRGFLWDEGFHHLLIARWDRELSKDALAHWLGVVHANGWIPREQILGAAAESRVPDEFITQTSTTANPPTLLLAFEHLLATSDEGETAYFRAAFPRLRAWFDWLRLSQAGERPNSFYWRGRDYGQDHVRLNPRTLASGLDDYPRAHFPTSRERHVDLHAWIVHGARLMSRIGAAIGDADAEATYARAAADAQETLLPYHWDADAREFRDWGRHAPDGITAKTKEAWLARRRAEATHTFVPAGPGYVSLFPFLLGLLDPETHAEQLDGVVRLMETELMQDSRAGLLSLGPSSPYFNARNTADDPPYWRGAVWININYLALRALHETRGDERLAPALAERMDALYARLRDAVWTNISRVYARKHFIYEQYLQTGDGSGCRPFTGWSSLVLLIMAQDF